MCIDKEIDQNDQGRKPTLFVSKNQISSQDLTLKVLGASQTHKHSQSHQFLFRTIQ